MPITKTAKRALRVNKRKEAVNKLTTARMDVALRLAKKTKGEKYINEAISLVDRAAKKKVLRKAKAARIKSSLSKMLRLKSTSPKKTKGKKKTS